MRKIALLGTMLFLLAGFSVFAETALETLPDEQQPTETNYQTCMRYCMAVHSYDYCQADCKPLAASSTSPDSSGLASPLGQK